MYKIYIKLGRTARDAIPVLYLLICRGQPTYCSHHVNCSISGPNILVQQSYKKC